MRPLFQSSPEALQPAPSLDEALLYHGLTRERIASEVIRWLESVRLEDPAVYNALTHDPPLMQDYIARWDFVFSTGMTTDYPARRSWNTYMAFREFIQNALDIETKVFGYDAIAVNIYQNAVGTHIVDRGPGIPYTAFRLGGSDKQCFERGFFGEGMKVAAAEFVRQGSTVYIFNKQGQVFKFTTPPGTNTVVLTMGRSRIPVEGTEVLVYAATMSPQLLTGTIFQAWLNHMRENAYIVSRKLYDNEGCEGHNMPNTIVASTQSVDALWVRDIWVNKISQISRYPSLFGYNLWWTELEPNRVSVSRVTELSKQVAKAQTPESMKLLLDRTLVLQGGVHRITDEYFEVIEADWYNIEAKTEDAVAEWVKDKGYSWTVNEAAVAWASYLGANPLIIPSNLQRAFIRAPHMEKALIEINRKRAEATDQSLTPREIIPVNTLRNLIAAEIIVKRVHRTLTYDYEMQRMPQILVAKQMPGAHGEQLGDIIIIHYDRLEDTSGTLETLLHEYAHYYGILKHGQARDLSEAFEAALGDVAAAAVQAMTYEEINSAYNRARHGAWGAKGDYTLENSLTEIETFLAQDSKVYAHFTREPLISLRQYTPLIVVFSVDPADPVAAGRIDDITMIGDISHILKFDLPEPSVDLYRKAVDIVYPLMHPRIVDAVAKEKGPLIYILLYNPATDKYEVYNKVVK